MNLRFITKNAKHIQRLVINLTAINEELMNLRAFCESIKSKLLHDIDEKLYAHSVLQTDLMAEIMELRGRVQKLESINKEL